MKHFWLILQRDSENRCAHTWSGSHQGIGQLGFVDATTLNAWEVL